MRAIRLRINAESEITTLDVGRTIRASQIEGDKKGTLIDPEILKTGTRINLPNKIRVPDVFGRLIDHVIVPSLSPDGRLEKSGEMIFLHPVTVAANQLLAYFEQSEGNISISVITRLVRLLYLSMIDRITGHRGVIATNVSGTRMSHSGRLVLIPQIDHSPEWVGISAFALEKADIKEGELIIIFRDPVIWTGSMEIVRAYPVDEDVIKLHPLLFKQLAADCDGDQIAFVKPPDEPGVKKEMETNLIKHTKEHAKWPKFLCSDVLPEDPDWDHIMEDTARRFTVTGESYGPGEVRVWKDLPKSVEHIEKIIGKPGRGKLNKQISEDPEIRHKIILATSWANLYMKGYLGVVGATARRLLIIMGEDTWTSGAANRCSEIIQQSTLDAKHHVDKDHDSLPIDIMEMFEHRGSWKNSSIENCVTLLIKAGIKEEDSRRIVIHYRVEIPIMLFVETNLPKKKEEIRDIVRNLVCDQNGNARTKLNIVPALEYIAKLMTKKLKKKVKEVDVFREIQAQFMLGLSDLIDQFYPCHAITHKSVSADMDKAIGLYQSVFHVGRQDRGAVFKHIWENR